MKAFDLTLTESDVKDVRLEIAFADIHVFVRCIANFQLYLRARFRLNVLIYKCKMCVET
jgi:hypothetical protein